MGREGKGQISKFKHVPVVYDMMLIIWTVSYGLYDMKRLYVDLRSNDLLFSYFGHMLAWILIISSNLWKGYIEDTHLPQLLRDSQVSGLA